MGIKLTKLGIDFANLPLYNLATISFRQNFLLFKKVSKICLCTSYTCDKENYFMTNNEIELLNLIRDSDNPEQALVIAIEVILGYLKQS